MDRGVWREVRGELSLTTAFAPFDVFHKVFLRSVWVSSFFPASMGLGSKVGIFGNLSKGVLHVLTLSALLIAVVYDLVLLCFLAGSTGKQVLAGKSGGLVIPTRELLDEFLAHF